MATILNTKFLIESRNIVHQLRTDKINKKVRLPNKGIRLSVIYIILFKFTIFEQLLQVLFLFEQL